MTREQKNEKHKLYAIFFNNIGVGIFIIGLVTPILGTLYNGNSSTGNSISLGYIISVFALSLFFHLIGRYELNHLE